MEKEVKEKYIHVRIEEGFKNTVSQAARDNGLTISSLINMLLHQWMNEKKIK